MDWDYSLCIVSQNELVGLTKYTSDIQRRRDDVAAASLSAVLFSR